jgi:hypothetical protein
MLPCEGHERRNDLEIVKGRAKALHDPTRIDLLFTMSEIPHHAIRLRMNGCEVMFSRTICGYGFYVQPVFALRASPGTLRIFSSVAAPREA